MTIIRRISEKGRNRRTRTTDTDVGHHRLLKVLLCNICFAYRICMFSYRRRKNISFAGKHCSFSDRSIVERIQIRVFFQKKNKRFLRTPRRRFRGNLSVAIRSKPHVVVDVVTAHRKPEERFQYCVIQSRINRNPQVLLLAPFFSLHRPLNAITFDRSCVDADEYFLCRLNKN